MPITYWHDWPTNITGIGSFFVWMNSSANGKLGLILLTAIFIITFVTLKTQSATKSFAASSFITLVLGVILLRIGLVGISTVFIIAVLVAVGAILVRNESEKMGL